MRWNLTAMVLAVMSLGVVVPAVASEKVENPEYGQWASFKPGSFNTIAMTATVQGQTMQMRMTVTLKEVAEDKVVVTKQMVMMHEGQEMAMPAEEDTIERMVTKDELDPDAAAMLDPEAEKGEEKLTFAGSEHECTWYAFDGDMDGTQASGKVWMCPKVPGHAVKMDVEVKGQGTFSGVCVEYEAK